MPRLAAGCYTQPGRPQAAGELLLEVDFVAAANALLSHARGRSRVSLVMVGLHHNHFLPGLQGRNLDRLSVDHGCWQKSSARGGASICKNPARSLHWALPQEQRVWQSGRWHDACGVELAPSRSGCATTWMRSTPGPPWLATHDPKVERDGGRFYPSREEAEYTALLCFALAVAASWWAVRTGRAVLRAPRCPRSSVWAAGLAAVGPKGSPFFLGLRLGGPQARGLPVRAQAQAVLGEEKFLPEGHVYMWAWVTIVTVWHVAAWGGIPGAQALPRNLQKHSQESLVVRYDRGPRQFFPLLYFYRVVRGPGA